ncbi:amidohydrolase family protein [Miniimonas sp. S16]|uniref:amidohydrolase family protein n=1 Tax=Miniimonas sp. S16 TaxID=2171623 RepID=UPI000D526DC3|nr:amidohydrolase family protein [Miniimonas sp. S16]
MGVTAWLDCTLWDGATDGWRSDAGLLVDHSGRVLRVGSGDDVLAEARFLARAGSGGPDGAARVVQLDGARVVPGLVNGHVHFSLALPGPMQDSVHSASEADLVLLMAGNARETLHAGVTTVRLVGESRFVDFALKRAVAAGLVPGPRIRSAGHALCCTGGHGHDADGQEADGADGFRRATREQLRAGADLIKVCISGGISGEHEAIDTPQLTDEELRAVIDTAHDWGRKVTAHAGPSHAVERALALGLDGVEHGYELTRDVCDTMAAGGVWFTPTISVSRCEDYFVANRVPTWMIDRALGAGPRHWESLQHAIAAGVPIALGTDMPPQALYDGTTATVRELEHMQDAGMTPLEVMRAATANGARWLDEDGEYGTLVPGAAADLLVLDGDPLADVSALRDLRAVVQGGRVVRDDRDALRTRILR